MKLRLKMNAGLTTDNPRSNIKTHNLCDSVKTGIYDYLDHESLSKSLGCPKEVIEDTYKIFERIRLLAKHRNDQIIGLTSASPNEGTSTIATLISVIAAEIQKQMQKSIKTQLSRSPL